ncbi:MAG: sulfatase-like hydrolase/transferase [Gemmatimonadota bacterium]|nr:sulfatase-like hydrolase/transferase [Gemmatimonadota bacterium]MDP6803150.1 sulfatase-like hydrolase/transferase [Gemmatimonadota bacterium]MDP7030681.1 sulfatase-like hydrolase/transferase [Gemmatimonadota bacterium]
MKTRIQVEIVLVAAFLALCGCGRKEAPPGVLLVTIDTCRADRIGCYGSTLCETPTLDGLAGRGVAYLDATATAPVTLPSHCSILTGLYPDRHTVRDNGAGRLPGEARTIPEILRDEGWSTAAFLAAVPLESRYGTGQGFDLYEDDLADDLPEGDILNRLYSDQRTADRVVDLALPWMTQAAAGTKPYFAWVHFFDPHQAYEPPPHIASRYEDAPYEGEIAFVDEQLGRLLGGLGEAVRSRLLVAVTADHGESLGEHEEPSHGFFVYDSALRVPWIMAGPGVPEGVRVEDPVSLVQFAPTLLELVGVPVPSGLDGGSAAGLLRGDDAAPDAIFAEALFPRLNFDWEGSRSIRKGGWKYIDAPRPELYDLTADPHETRNVLSGHPGEARALRAELWEHSARGGALGAVEAIVDEAAREQLEGLGYVGGVGASSAPAAEAALWTFRGPDPKDGVTVFALLQKLPQLILSGKTAEAKAVAAEMDAAIPGDLPVLRKVAQLWRRAEAWEETEAAWRKVVALDARDAAAWLGIGEAALRTGDRPGATEAYERAAEANPTDARAWRMAGSLLAETGDHAGAVAALERAVAADSSAEALADLGRALKDAGRAREGLAAYDRAISADPGFAGAVTGRASILTAMGRPAEAVETLRRGLVASGEDAGIANNLAWILADHRAVFDPEEAYRLARLAASKEPDDAAILDTLGWAAIRSGRPTEAVEPLRRAWEATRDAEVRAHLGIALAESGREADGRAHVRAALAERPDLGSVPEVAEWAR